MRELVLGVGPASIPHVATPPSHVMAYEVATPTAIDRIVFTREDSEGEGDGVAVGRTQLFAPTEQVTRIEPELLVL